MSTESTQEPLGRWFLSAVSDDALRQKLEQDPTLEDSLRRGLEAARENWPELVVSDAEFLRFFATRVAAQRAFSQQLSHAAELYFCCACLRQDVQAVRKFEAQFVPILRQALSRLRLDGEAAAELLQELRVRLLAAGEARPAKLADYCGTGSLKNWLRVVAVNAARNACRKMPLELPMPFDDNDSDLPVAALITGAEPELEHLRSHHLGTMREALIAASAELSSEERTLLRWSVLDGLSIDQLSRLLRVHRATAARRVAAAQGKLLAATKQQLSRRANLRADEVTSVLKALITHLDISLSNLLPEPPTSTKKT